MGMGEEVSALRLVPDAGFTGQTIVETFERMNDSYIDHAWPR
jgi:ubiquinone biosynthesis protein COQ9